jgi:hypothetical protein
MGSIMIGWKYCAVLLFPIVGFDVGATAQAPPTSEPQFAQQCRSLTSVDFSRIVDAPTQVIEAVTIEGNAETAAHCALRGYVSPNVGFELKLPVTWNGRLFMAGNGGYGGSAHYVERGEEHACTPTLQKGYACIQTDSGHMSTIRDGKWAYNNAQAEIDYGYRATHVATLAGKGIIAHYYGEAPDTQDFFRLFMLPGVRHCGGGEGAHQVDFLSYLEAWVEKSQAPDVMIGTHSKDATGPAFTRPHYPYPLRAKYKGSGDPNDAKSFEPVSPR